MVTIIHGGHREGLCFAATKAFDKLLRETGTEVKLYNLRDYHFGFCCGNQPCQESGVCIYNDLIAKEIIPSIAASNALIIFTPTYFNLPPAILKNFIDRCNLLLTVEDRKRLKFGAWVSGQTVGSSAEECFKSLVTFAEICEFKMLNKGKIIRIETDTQQTGISQDDIYNLQKLVKEIQRYD